MTDAERTLYVLVDYTDNQKVVHAVGESVKFAKDDREANELLRRGVLSPKPVRRSAGGSPGRSKKGDGA
jgi:hypothetical protein